nr:unnamed protein product [Digitaria exilis]
MIIYPSVNNWTVDRPHHYNLTAGRGRLESGDLSSEPALHGEPTGTGQEEDFEFSAGTGTIDSVPAFDHRVAVQCPVTPAVTVEDEIYSSRGERIGFQKRPDRSLRMKRWKGCGGGGNLVNPRLVSGGRIVAAAGIAGQRRHIKLPPCLLLCGRTANRPTDQPSPLGGRATSPGAERVEAERRAEPPAGAGSSG